MSEMIETMKKTKKLNLLFVEDSEITRMSSVELFEEFFSEIFIAVNGQEGLELYRELKDEIDIILTDVHMPVMNGIDMIEKIQENNDNNIPILLFTGENHTDIEDKFKHIIIQGFISKPFIISDFIKSLNKVI